MGNVWFEGSVTTGVVESVGFVIIAGLRLQVSSKSMTSWLQTTMAIFLGPKPQISTLNRLQKECTRTFSPLLSPSPRLSPYRILYQATSDYVDCINKVGNIVVKAGADGKDTEATKSFLNASSEPLSKSRQPE
jgi:hypothetical protein